MTRIIAGVALGIGLAVWVGYPMAEAQAKWENQSLACWPNRTYPEPLNVP